MKYRILAALVAASALGAVVGPRLEARQAAAMHQYSNRVVTAGTEMNEWLAKGEQEGWEVFQIMPVSHPVGGPIVPQYLIVARRPK